MEASYITSAMKSQQLPRYTLPEVAFIGRSNTGKSSLLNSLLGRVNLARASRTPGRTQMINFFDVGGRLIFVDLPGYGFSVARPEVAANWQELIDAYLQRPNIRDFLFLMDVRRDVTVEDLALMELLGRNIPLLIVLTKADKLSRSKVNEAVQKVRAAAAARQIPVRDILAISSLKRTGIRELRELLIRD
jgi:GTP-binding protein